MDLNAEKKRIAAETLHGLTRDDSPHVGSDQDPVLVIFSDFQCPYCRRLSDAVASLLTSDPNSFEVIFKQRPLGMHDWARRAALASICVSDQSNAAFWQLEGFLFKNQSTLTVTNFDAKLRQFAEVDPGLKMVRSGNATSLRIDNAFVARFKKLDDKKKVNGSKTANTPPKADPPAEFKDGKPVFGSKPAPLTSESRSLFDTAADQPEAVEQPVEDDETTAAPQHPSASASSYPD